MLANGRINADEAERLLAALEGTRAAAADVSPRKPKYLRVLVEGTENGSPLKANVRAPMDLLRAGVRLASLIPPQARAHVDEAMHEHGVHLDLKQIKPENLEELVDKLGEVSVDVDNEGMKVRVFCE